MSSERYRSRRLDEERRNSRYDTRLIARTTDHKIIFVNDNGLLKLPGGKSKLMEPADEAMIREATEEAYDEVAGGPLHFRDIEEHLSIQLQGHERVYFVLLEPDPDSGMRRERLIDPQHLRDVGDDGEIVTPLSIPEILDIDIQKFHRKHLETVLAWVLDQEPT